MEIEKKFLIGNIPGELSNYEKEEIVQAYICRSPTIRIRKKGERYILTVKAKPEKLSECRNSVLVNREFECALSEKEYESLLIKTDGYPIKKTRYLIPLAGGLIAETDVFRERLSGLVLAEVEFSSVEEAENFSPPEWFLEDVSSDFRYSNAELSKIDQYSERLF